MTHSVLLNTPLFVIGVLSCKNAVPNGNIEIIQNLNNFCNKKDLNVGNMCEVANGKRKHHKHYKVKKIEVDFLC